MGGQAAAGEEQGGLGQEQEEEGDGADDAGGDAGGRPEEDLGGLLRQGREKSRRRPANVIKRGKKIQFVP